MTHYYFFEGSNFLKDIYHNYDNIVSRKKDISPYIIESLNIKKVIEEMNLIPALGIISNLGILDMQ